MIVSFRMQMEALKRDRKITVYLPKRYYQEDKHYPVLYIQDGQNAFLTNYHIVVSVGVF